MAVDRHVVRRIGEDHLSRGGHHEERRLSVIERIPADQTMRTDRPNIAWTAACLDILAVGNASSSGSPGSIGTRPSTSASISAIEKPVSARSKPRSISSRPCNSSARSSSSQPRSVRARCRRGHRPVSRSCSSARAGDTAQVHIEELGRFYAPVTGENPVLLVDQDGIREAERLNTSRNLAESAWANECVRSVPMAAARRPR